MQDIDLIKSAQLYEPHPETGKMGITLAGVMLLGTDDLILKVCPPHRTDLILRKVNVDRYDDRDLVITNLIDSYDRILDFIKNTWLIHSTLRVLSAAASGTLSSGRLPLISSSTVNTPVAPQLD
jgi:predicted HTH transcriptional regulator